METQGWRTWVQLLAAFICISCICPGGTYACSQQYSRELRYLDYYLGISPANDEGAIKTDENQFNKYVEDASALDCNFGSNSLCRWSNMPSDGLLDTSDFYLFTKTDKKMFPAQVRPGNASPPPGANFVLAGNVTNQPQSAVLSSSPIVCQNTEGVLTFEYWLYNAARLEVVLLRVNPARHHLQVISRPPVDCHFLKTTSLCRVEVPRMSEPFRIGIRAFSLRDQSVGSFAMLGRIRYDARVCGPHDMPALFGARPLTKWLRQRRPIVTASDLNCPGSAGGGAVEECLWASVDVDSSGAVSPTSSPSVQQGHWAIGEHTKRWDELVRSDSRPTGQFFFQHVDPMSAGGLPQLRSVLIPCTQTPSALTFRFWMSPSLQAQLCTLSSDDIQLSCLYLEEWDAPGPVTIDVDTADRQPFRFAFSVIKFNPALGGVFAIANITYNGFLCHERVPLRMLSTEAPPPALSQLLQLQPFPEVGTPGGGYSPTLYCDFEREFCPHWVKGDVGDDGEKAPAATQKGDGHSSVQFLYAHVPEKIPMAVKHLYKGGAAIAVFPLSGRNQHEGHEGEYVKPVSAVLTSQVISCARKARLTLTYFVTEGVRLSICATKEKCVLATRKRRHGDISVTLNAEEPFRIRIVAESTGTRDNRYGMGEETFALIKKIRTSEKGFCRIETPNEVSCKVLSCHFQVEGPCRYQAAFSSPAANDSFSFQPGEGMVARLGQGGKQQALFRSPPFELSSPIELHLEAALSTFGARLYICPDLEENHRREKSGRDAHKKPSALKPQKAGSSSFGQSIDMDSCELLLGPKVVEKQSAALSIQLDPGIRRFLIVAEHDNYEEFGDAEFTLIRTQLSDLDGAPVCNSGTMAGVRETSSAN